MQPRRRFRIRPANGRNGSKHCELGPRWRNCLVLAMPTRASPHAGSPAAGVPNTSHQSRARRSPTFGHRNLWRTPAGRRGVAVKASADSRQVGAGHVGNKVWPGGSRRADAALGTPTIVGFGLDRGDLDLAAPRPAAIRISGALRREADQRRRFGRDAAFIGTARIFKS